MADGPNINDTSIFPLTELNDDDQIPVGRPGLNSPAIVKGITIKNLAAGGVAEAPEDGVLYGRKNKSWVAVPQSAVEVPDEATAAAQSAIHTGVIYGVPEETT